MSSFDTEQAAREASGAHPYGRYLEEFEVGDVYKHWPAKTVTEADDHLFCLITMNHHPLHINDVYAKDSQQGTNVVVGPLVYSLALGMSVSDVCGKAIANLATEELSIRRRCSMATRSSASQKSSRSRSRSRSRPRDRQGAHARPQPGRRARRRVQAPRARSRAANPGTRFRSGQRRVGPETCVANRDDGRIRKSRKWYGGRSDAGGRFGHDFRMTKFV